MRLVHHRDEAIGGPDKSRAAFARLLSSNRVAVAEQIVQRLPRLPGRQRSLLAQSLLIALARAVESANPEAVVHWAREARAAQSKDLVSDVIAAACDLTLDLAAEHHDSGILLVLMEIIRTKVDDALWLEVSDSYNAEERPTIEAALAMLRARDEVTCVHSYATGVWCRRLAESMGLSKTTTERIARAGMLHDVGKIGTPDAILLKAGPLNAAEWAVMRQHAVLGAEMLSEIPTLAHYAPIVRGHHERIDGAGYPDGLVGDEILFESRVVAVADGFHAMISERPYRGALSYGEALGILREGRGTQWDARIVDAMVPVAAMARNRSSDATIEVPPLDPTYTVAATAGWLAS